MTLPHSLVDPLRLLTTARTELEEVWLPELVLMALQPNQRMFLPHRLRPMLHLPILLKSRLLFLLQLLPACMSSQLFLPTNWDLM
jgi:hypothetical protein